MVKESRISSAIADKRRIHINQTAVGDGANDFSDVEFGRFRIAFHAKPGKRKKQKVLFQLRSRWCFVSVGYHDRHIDNDGGGKLYNIKIKGC
jgi:hypothetical protein